MGYTVLQVGGNSPRRTAPAPPRAANRIALADGRSLAYAEYGASTGVPVIYCHGFPGSRLEAGLADTAARRLGARLIAADRPGIGLSDFCPTRRVLDWPEDVAALANGLGLEKFSVLGVSGGAPYALACALRFPERVRSTTIVSPLGPAQWLHGGTGMALASRLSLRLAAMWPATTPLLCAIFRPVIRHAGRLALALVAVGVSRPDRQMLREPAFRATLATSAREAFRQGSRGAAKDLALLAAPWQFDPGDVASEVDLWHGNTDRVVPVTMARALEQRLSACRATYMADEGHYSLITHHVEEILSGTAERI